MQTGGGAALQDVPLVGAAASDSDVSDAELSEEDLEFVQEHSQQLGFLESLNRKELDKWVGANDVAQASCPQNLLTKQICRGQHGTGCPCSAATCIRNVTSTPQQLCCVCRGCPTGHVAVGAPEGTAFCLGPGAKGILILKFRPFVLVLEARCRGGVCD